MTRSMQLHQVPSPKMKHVHCTPEGVPPRLYIYAALLQMFFTFASSALTCNKLPTPEGYKCSCDDRFGHDSIGGWHLACFSPQRLDVQAFMIEYVISDSVRVQCDSGAPFQEGMYQAFNISEVQRFSFSYCEMPNGSFADVLQGMTVTSLRLFDCKMDGALSKTLFEGLDSLKRLSVTGNKNLTELPEDVFGNLTSLVTLELNNNGFKELPEKVFWPLTNITSIQLGGNQLESVHSSQFQGLSNLVNLYLYRNKLKELPVGVFSNLTSLKNLDLLLNQLTNITSDHFADLMQLEYLKLGGNPFQELPDALFIHNKKLGELNLNALTKLGSPPEKLLMGLGRLENISFSDSNFSSIPGKLFAYAPNMKSIKMQNNRLTTLPANVFRENTKLLYLDFSYNDINSLPSSVFEKQYVLETLVFYKNDFTQLKAGPFDNLVSLKLLNFESNFITSIEKDTFQRLQKLEDLKLGSNKLEKLEGLTPFGYNKKLKRVDLSRNQLAEFPYVNWEIYLAIEKLNLDYNNISYFRVPNLLSKKAEFSLRHNKVTMVEVSTLLLTSYDNHKEKVYSDNSYEHFYRLQGNPFDCNCQLYEFIKYLRDNKKKESVIFEDSDYYACQSPRALRGKGLLDLGLGELQCNVTENCPEKCACFFRRIDSTTHVNCSVQGLTTIPNTAPLNASILYVQDNHITSLANLTRPQWQNLSEIYVDNNALTSVDANKLPSSLRTLSLSNNKISRFSSETMDMLSNNSLNLMLSGNPWVCDCSSFNFKTWLRGHVFQVKDYSDIKCNKPLRYNDSLSLLYINEIPDSTYCPPDNIDQRRQLAIVSGVCVVLAVLLVLVSVLYYQHRQTILAYVYINFNNLFVCIFNEEDLDEDKLYDAFISYSSADRDVAMGILNILENGPNEEKFKLCIHERDWLPGYNISWNIVNSVQNSRRTILVVSKDFLESLWFQVEFHTAYYQMLEDRVDRLIVITKGDLPAKDSLDKDLRFLLSTKTYLIWGERWFWEKLRYAMPHRKQPAPSNKLPLRNRPNTQMVKTVEDQIATLANGTKLQKDKAKEEAPADKVTQNNNANTEDTVLEVPPRRSKRGAGITQPTDEPA
ncbi:protein toll-like isoform X2 [Ornithodoros turicata]|uniref:protein toll-like isoform X2 n=1 Tax=Ornithodoros turicata TaxID=34597 RepID=UPI003139DF41